MATGLGKHVNGFDKNCPSCIIKNIKTGLDQKPLDIEKIRHMQFYLSDKKTGIDKLDQLIEKIAKFDNLESPDFLYLLAKLNLIEDWKYKELLPKKSWYRK